MATAAGSAQKKYAREYETIYIMQSAVDPDEADRVASKLAEVVTRLDGKLTKVDNWGKRRLAYNIKKNTRGVFVYLKYVGYQDIVAEIERNLRMTDSVIRFQTIQVGCLQRPRDLVQQQIRKLLTRPVERLTHPGFGERPAESSGQFPGELAGRRLGIADAPEQDGVEELPAGGLVLLQGFPGALEQGVAPVLEKLPVGRLGVRRHGRGQTAVVHQLVGPPLTEAIHRSSRTSSWSQRKPSGGSGEPVVPTHWTRERS